MISILNASMERVAIIKDIINPWRFEEINGENKLEFKAILSEKVANNLVETNIVEFSDDYFDIAYYSKNINEDGTATINAECEHISYRLNDEQYNLDYFAYTGTPTQVLAQVLNGTGFTVGALEYADNITYSAQEKKSRRAILMGLVALLGGEVIFNKFSVSILNRRGSTDLQIFTKGKNIKVISKVFDGRVQPNKIAYTCTPIVLPNKDINLGDDVLLVQPELAIQDTLRVIMVGYNPLDTMEKEIEIANFINGLEDQLYKIETSTVAKEKIYNGCRIGPDDGFVAERSDGKAKTIMNATEGISVYSDVGEGIERNFYVDLLGRIIAKALDISGDATFKGTITASTINGGTITGSIINTLIDARIGNNLYIGDTEDTFPSTKEIIFFDSANVSEEAIIRATRSVDNYPNLEIYGASINLIAWDGISFARLPSVAGKLLATEDYVDASVNGYATQTDINNAISDHVATYHSGI